MTPIDTPAQRSDTYRHFRFRVKWDGRDVAGFAKLSALQRTTEVVEHREGGEPQGGHKAPARTKFDAITLERGITQDREFEQWAGAFRSTRANRAIAVQDTRPSFERDAPPVRHSAAKAAGCLTTSPLAS